MHKITTTLCAAATALTLTACGTDDVTPVADETTTRSSSSPTTATTSAKPSDADIETAAITECHDAITEMVNQSDNKPDSFEWADTPELATAGDYGSVAGTGYIRNGKDIPFEHDIRCSVTIEDDGTVRLTMADAELAW